MPIMFPTLTTALLYSASGPTYSDLSRDINDFQRNPQTIPMASTDFLYIGRLKAFSDLWVEIVTPSTASNTLTIQYLNSTAWQTIPWDLDDTQGFTRSGWIRWNRNAMSTTGSENSGTFNWITECRQLSHKVLDALLVRQLFGAATPSVQGIGIVFSDDNALKREVPDVMRFLPNDPDNNIVWNSWILTHISARDTIAQRLRSAGMVKIDTSTGYPVDFDEWDFFRIDQIKDAAKWLALARIFQNLSSTKGDIYDEKAGMYFVNYEDSWKVALLSLDFLNNGQENPGERAFMHNTAEVSRY